MTSADAPKIDPCSGRIRAENTAENQAAIADSGSERAVSGVSDQHLVDLVVGGNLDALMELYDRFATVSYGFALAVLQSRSLAEDAVEAGFLDVWQSAGGYAPRDSSVRAWVLARILRQAVAHKHNVDQSGNGDQLELTDSGAFDLLALLPSEEREAIALAYVGGLNRSDAAAVAGVTADEIDRRMLSGLRRLKGPASAPLSAGRLLAQEPFVSRTND